MNTEYPTPRRFQEWLSHLNRQRIGLTFDHNTAAWMRVIANTKNSAIFFVSGRECIPYVDWLMDGMSMNNRLILHLEQRSHKVDELTNEHFHADIRVAIHHQDLGGFLSDVSRHRFDFVLIDLNEVELDVIPALLELLSEHGILVSLGPGVLQDPLKQQLSDKYFSAQLQRTNNGYECLIFTKKALQHLAVRRGGRRRHLKGRTN